MDVLEPLTSKIQGASNKWPWVFFFLVVIFGAIYLIMEYKSRKLEMKWYALNILESEKNLGITDSSNAINEALKGDLIADTVNDLNFIKQD